ncbi:hypothetical protein ACIOGZ_29615 [Kitasatospora sp. NPDC088160]|uniref:hypothetical protein n=1 Tax=Kitasatospora sp. NPDC088160 TaxID=3364072 RepID=UPI0037FC554D
MGRAPLPVDQAPVPYVTIRHGESPERPPVVYTTNGHGVSVGIGYAEERDEDRDRRSVLWERLTANPDGAPRYRYTHARRQGECLDDLRCQVTYADADENKLGVLFLLEDARSRADIPAGWPEGVRTLHPPLSLEGAAYSVLACRHLAEGWAAVRVTDPDVEFGYRGTLYRPSPDGPIPFRSAAIAYDDPLVGWLVASAQEAVLHGCTIVDLAADLEQAGHTDLARQVAAAYPQQPRPRASVSR